MSATLPPFRPALAASTSPPSFARFHIQDPASAAERRGSISWVELKDELAFELAQPPWLGLRYTDRTFSPEKAKWLAPVAPSKILCIGRNYRAHAAELGNVVPSEPLLFMKPPSSVIGPGDKIVLPPQSSRVEFEVEIGVVVGRQVKKASPADALDAVFGATLVCDVTARDLQKKDGQWARAKGFDTFCPVGPVLCTGLDWSALEFSLSQNGQVRQRGNTADMVFSIGALLSYISQAITLEPGDLVVTGTPEGTGPIAPGDRLRLFQQDIGALEVGVVAG